jgi:predicted DNA-binding transcriptional regulator YafY
VWYAIGYCRLRQANRSFRVDRIIALTLLDETFEVPADFDIRAYLAANPTEQPLIKMRLRFIPEMTRLAYDTRAMWESIEEQADGSVIATMLNPDLLWAASTALSFGPAVRVLEPEEVKQKVFEWASEVANRYMVEWCRTQPSQGTVRVKREESLFIWALSAQKSKICDRSLSLADSKSAIVRME